MRWRIQHKIVLPFTALVVVVMGLSAWATIVVLGRYADREADESLRRWLETVAATGYLVDFEKIKAALGVEIVASAEEGDVVGTTLDLGSVDRPDRQRLSAFLASAEPGVPGTITLMGRMYRTAHLRVPPDRRVVMVTMMAPLEHVERTKRQTALAVGLAALVGMALVAAVGSRIAHALTAPIHRLVSVARAVAGGDWSRQAPTGTRDEVGDLAAAFNEMTAQLRRTRQELIEAERLATAGQMAATFAHEIRNPLSSMKMMLQLAAETDAHPRTAAYIQNSLEEIDRLDDLVEEMLDFSRPPPLQFRPCRLRDAVQAVLDVMEQTFRQQDVSVRFDVSADPVVLGDEDALKQAVWNVLLNALEAQPRGGEVAVSLRRSGTRAEIEVADRGPGLGDEARAQLFRPFFTTKTRGSGLGLVTTKRVIEQHGGEVRLQDRAGGGTQASLLLPMPPDTPAVGT
jgi:signal transduction histidine kinase